MKAKFKSKEEYLEWCAEQCQKIKTSCIAMNEDNITKIIDEIDQKLHLHNHQDLYEKEL